MAESQRYVSMPPLHVPTFALLEPEPDKPASEPISSAFVPLSQRFAECRNSMASRPQSEPAETVVPVNRAARRAAQRASKR